MIENLGNMPEWISIVPPLVAIAFALIFREVITALIIGILSGTLLISIYAEGWEGIIPGIFMPVDLVLEAVSPAEGGQEHMSVIVFSLLIGGMAHLITANGSMQALIDRIAKRATSKRRGLFLTWLMGVIIFFDDYANTMVVGNTMRPLTDKLKISREKLAYIVDSTAAPIAAIALVTTWIGAEVNFIEDGVSQLSSFSLSKSAYGIFLDSLKYSFYPILTLIFILILIYLKKDFGPMCSAEKRLEQHRLEAEDKSSETSMWRGIIPILIILFGTLTGLVITGFSAEVWADQSLGFSKKLSLIIGASDSFKALTWASFASLAYAILASIKVLGLEDSIAQAVEGFKKMIPAILILVLAWSLAEVTNIMGTANFVSGVMEGRVNIVLLPALTFVISALIAFATGSSWGTMAILYPVIITSSWKLGVEAGIAEMDNYQYLLNVISSVLAGSVLGDHCSPISDTTILSSLATECNHISHVKTQMPYALTVGSVSIVCGSILSAVGLPIWICYLIAIIALFSAVSYFGKYTS
ncbi:Na+/H+ antiporter NhaC family protein [bacterium]|nr:Na+/H+ antiporter NhaC family protein [bacterium]